MSEIILYLGDQPVRVHDSLVSNYIQNGYREQPAFEPASNLIAADTTPIVLPPVLLKPTGTIDVNSASAEELATIPNVGVKIAKAVIDNRPYQSVEDLIQKVQSINWINTLHLIAISPVETQEASA